MLSSENWRLVSNALIERSENSLYTLRTVGLDKALAAEIGSTPLCQLSSEETISEVDWIVTYLHERDVTQPGTHSSKVKARARGQAFVRALTLPKIVQFVEALRVRSGVGNRPTDPLCVRTENHSQFAEH